MKQHGLLPAWNDWVKKEGNNIKITVDNKVVYEGQSGSVSVEEPQQQTKNVKYFTSGPVGAMGDGACVKNVVFSSGITNFSASEVKVVIEGNVEGNVICNNNVEIKGNVGGDVTADNNVNIAGNVGGDVKSDNNVNCGNVIGNVKADNNVICNSVKGKVKTGW